MVFLFIPNIYFSSKLVGVTKKDGKEEIRPSQTQVGSIFNIRQFDSHDIELMFLKQIKALLLPHFYFSNF